jgi:two-component system chemotaxis sensor kinase CheA
VNVDEELVEAFLEESHENLDQLDLDLVALESRPHDPELLARVFRAIHTIKGTSGFLGYERLQSLSHSGEDLLSALRAGDLTIDADITTSLLALVDAIREILRHIAADGHEGDDDLGDRHIVADLQRHLTTTAEPEATQAHPTPAPAREPAPADAETTVRVDIAVLDRLQDLVGELTLTRNRIGAAIASDDGSVAQSYQELRLLSGELRDEVMQARLQPIGAVIGKIPRIVRSLATELGKSVQVDVTGEHVGVDRTIIEALRDPLTHLVRNALDHGIETPDERILAGKPAQAHVRIDATLEAGRVQIDVSDDGRGIAVDLIVGKAVSLGILTADQAAALPEDERLDLMFRSGLSSRETVSTVSGRGVGMDVVRAHLERIGGSVGVWTAPGVGSRFRLTVPLTLAIAAAVTVRCVGQWYVIPQVDVERILVVADGSEGAEAQGAGILHRNGSPLPLVDLAASLGLPASERAAAVVAVKSHGRAFGLLVHEVGDGMEAVVKPLPTTLRSVPIYAGVTILADGRPALILDTAGIGAEAGIPATAREAVVEALAPDRSVPLLLATGQAGERIAFPLRAVHRLEHFRAASIERSEAFDVIRYGDVLLPLVPVTAGSDLRGCGDVLTAVVCTSSAGLVGVTVARFDEIVELPAAPADIVDIERLIGDAGVGGPR